MKDPSNSKAVLDILLEQQQESKNIDWNQRECTTTTSTGDGYSILHYACMNGAIDVVQFCLEMGNADPNLTTFTYESTPLKWAASKGHVEIVKLLLKFGAKETIKDYFGYTPLQYACLGGSPNVASTLVFGISSEASTATRNIDDSSGNDDHRHHDELISYTSKLLNKFSQDKEDVNAIDEAGFMPLHIACSIGHRGIVKTLLELGAFADEANEEGRTPLFFAAGCGHEQIICDLLEWGASISTCTNIEKTIYHVATPGWTALHEASEKNQVPCANMLIEKRMDMNICNAGKETPLSVAAQNGNFEVAELLVQRGADVNLGDDWNTTPLHISCRQNHKRIASMLVENGADVHSCNNYNETPLHQACWLGRTEISHLLVENGANSEAKNKDNQTPLDYAKSRGHKNLAAQLSKKLSK